MERGRAGGRAIDARGCGRERRTTGTGVIWPAGLENAKQVLGRAAELSVTRGGKRVSIRIDAECVADHNESVGTRTHLSTGHTGRERVLRDGDLFVDEVIGKVVGSAAGVPQRARVSPKRRKQSWRTPHVASRNDRAAKRTREPWRRQRRRSSACRRSSGGNLSTGRVWHRTRGLRGGGVTERSVTRAQQRRRNRTTY